MTDARLTNRIVQLPQAVTPDLLLMPTGELDTANELATAAVVALGTDRLANPDDVLPGLDDDDRRGWWGDLDAETIWDGWPIGCRLWLLSRAKITGAEARQGSTLAMIEGYIHEAFQPFIDRKVASSKEVQVTRIDTGRVDAVVKLYRGPVPIVQLRYADLWLGIEG